MLPASISRLLHRALIQDPEEIKRIQTLRRVFRYVFTVVVAVLAVLFALSELGVSIAPLLATAGVAGVAVGFGAQSLVKDYFTGFVLLAENQIRQGDVVEIAGKSGEVEEITLRYVRLRDYEGCVHYVPNGVIQSVSNRSRSFVYAVLEIPVAFGENLGHAAQLMRETAASLRADPEFADRILDDLEVSGVDRWSSDSVVMKCRLKTASLQNEVVRRAFLQRLEAAFAQHGIETSAPTRVIYSEVASL